jgi:hypothetical protein
MTSSRFSYKRAYRSSLDQMMKIFRACIALGYVPLSWRVVRVVFIPKPGHMSYVQAKSFSYHPHCLSFENTGESGGYIYKIWSLGGISTALPLTCIPDWQVHGDGHPHSRS